MTTYRVGQAGATVFTEQGTALYRLTPGLIVVEGTIECAASEAAQHAALQAKRIWRYPNKRMAVPEDKAP